MITKERFFEIDTEIKDNIIQTLQKIKSKSVSNYILLLADGEYREEMLYNPTLNLNPNLIDYTIDKYKDINRLTFLADFLNTFYSFEDGKTIVEDNDQKIHLELMIYTHIWESKPFLKRMIRLANIDNGKKYKWQVKIDDTSKHNYIRNKIRKPFEKSNNNIAEIIKKSFNSSLRNAFAHSEYHFNLSNNNDIIYLDNYKGINPWEIKQLSLADWSMRFVYSALLSYHLFDIVSTCRKRLVTDFGTDTFAIEQPSRNKNEIRNIQIRYNVTRNSFEFCK